MGWETTVVETAAAAGLGGLAVLSFTEAVLQPVPPDLLVLPMAATADNSLRLFAIWAVATLSSVLGALVGAWFGAHWGRALMVRFRQERSLERLEALLERYGTLGVFIAAVSPIPYKVLGWAAGMGRMPRRAFVLAGLLGRGLRFGLEVVLVGVYGAAAVEAIQSLLDREILLAVLMLLGLALLWVGWTWWQGLSMPTPVDEEG